MEFTPHSEEQNPSAHARERSEELTLRKDGVGVQWIFSDTSDILFERQGPSLVDDDQVWLCQGCLEVKSASKVELSVPQKIGSVGPASFSRKTVESP